MTAADDTNGADTNRDGANGDGAKRYVAGTHRVVDPAATLARVLPLAPRMGITRVAVLTGLDVLGIPVVAATRPNSRSIAVHQGKGVSLAAAKASAVMEAVETFHAETMTLPLRLAAHDELADAADPACLPRAAGGAAGDARILWVEARELLTGGRVFVPHELVGADYTHPAPPGGGLFQATTNGLASGNHWLEAVLHGLYEVVERDAIALWRAGGEAARAASAVALDSIDGTVSAALLARYRAAAVAVRVWDVTSDIGLPCFVALAVAPNGADGVEPELGSGCHADRDVALSRALSEAAQARLTRISGARDDFAPEGYGDVARAERLALAGQWLDAPARRGFRRAPSCAGPTLRHDLDTALARLGAAGLRQVAYVDLTRVRYSRRPRDHPGPGRTLDAGLRQLYAGGQGAGSGTMSAIVFLGPSLPLRDAAAVLDATFLPPARQGDVFRAVQARRPRAIGLIDGVFLDVPAVWHRELLWALSEGVHVFGAASMGALRAAELAPFGMRGVGAIFEAYRTGAWPGDDAAFEDDDEVAVIHAPAAAGGAALSDPMVDLRASLAGAQEAGVIDPDASKALVAAMKRLHFPARSFARLHQEARALLGEPAAARLADWLGAHRVAQKRLDAIAMLEQLARLLAGDPPPFRAPFRFERALVWEQFVRAAPAPEEADALVLEELRLDPPARLAAERAALGRMVAPIEPADIAETLDRFRARQALWRRADLDAWMQRNGLGTAALERILHREAALDAAASQGGAALQDAILEHLRLTDRFAPLLGQARAKRQALAGRPLTPPGGPAMAAAMDWYFMQRLGEPLPRSTAGWARAQGWDNEQAFAQAVWRAYLFAEAGR